MGEPACGYAVYLFDSAYEALGDAIAPFVIEGPGGRQLCCRSVDTGGAFLEMRVDGLTDAGDRVEVEVIVPIAMVRMIVSTRGRAAFGFKVRHEAAATGLPVVGPDAPAAMAPPAALPSSGRARAGESDDRRRPPEG